MNGKLQWTKRYFLSAPFSSDSPCGDHGDCFNTHGSFECKCHAGFAKHENSVVCRDIDECAVENGGCDHLCENSAGSHACTCRPGFELSRNERSCFNINECIEGTHECDNNGYCQDSEGDYECACKRGYELLENKRTCEDINEVKIYFSEPLFILFLVWKWDVMRCRFTMHQHTRKFYMWMPSRIYPADFWMWKHKRVRRINKPVCWFGSLDF